MPILGFAALALALAISLWFAGVYMPVGREHRRSPRRSDRKVAIPVTISADRPGTPGLRRK